jgi:hypothetical protein
VAATVRENGTNVLGRTRSELAIVIDDGDTCGSR